MKRFYMAHNLYVTWGPDFKQVTLTPSFGFTVSTKSVTVFLDWLIFDYTVFFNFRY